MFSSQHNWIRFTWALLALPILQGSAQGQAETLSLRNDSQTPVWVQVSAVFQGRVTLNRTLLNPRMMTKITLPGDKNITLCDARIPTRQLFRDTIRSSP